ncbi:MAG: aminodeoxychorismate/anthranilate synthase component II [Desulfobacteraceae bacterium]|nr:aminodeoxychorismate/anthranilate synthase component II [Desulfobacteraceae bacterium]
MVLVIDNYDSFTYNLVQYLRQLGSRVLVHRNDAVTLPDIKRLKPDALVISPGPGRPEGAGICLPVVKVLSGSLPILGVCLGHQTIARAFGAGIVPAGSLMHGKSSLVEGDGESIYQGINKPFQAMRYHSLAVSPDDLPDCLKVSSRSDDGEIMGLRHRHHPTEGMQFHPESIMTPLGKRLLRNFLKSVHHQPGNSIGKVPDVGIA